MSVPATGDGEPVAPRIRPGRLALGAAMLAVVGAAWLWLAGDWRWLEGWVFLLLFSAFANGSMIWLARTNPELYIERQSRHRDTEVWDRRLMRLYSLLFLIFFVLAPLDASRFGWTQVPTALKWVAFVVLLAVAAAILHVMAVNNYLSRVVRIQNDRGHEVVSRGLYGVVRHPMYAAIIVLFLALPIALGSLWSLLPGTLIAALFVFRTAYEDGALTNGLSGYREYKQRVRYRLLPGAW